MKKIVFGSYFVVLCLSLLWVCPIFAMESPAIHSNNDQENVGELSKGQPGGVTNEISCCDNISEEKECVRQFFKAIHELNAENFKEVFSDKFINKMLTNSSAEEVPYDDARLKREMKNLKKAWFQKLEVRDLSYELIQDNKDDFSKSVKVYANDNECMQIMVVLENGAWKILEVDLVYLRALLPIRS